MDKAIALPILAIIAIFIDGISGHGYMKSPRSRNYVAARDGVWWGGDDTTPKKESCPQCLNRGGSTSRCGIDVTESHNYDTPLNYNSGPLAWNTQSSYVAGSVIDIESVLTAHHKGHFEIKACPVNPGEVATQACFDLNPLEFVSDELYGAQQDSNYPVRAYIAPDKYTFHHRYKLPDNISGYVLLQWFYYTANTCKARGYDNYSFPDPTWIGHVSTCEDIPADGIPGGAIGVPELFWNCAEIFIADANFPTPTPSLPNPSSTTPPPVVGSCGGGNVGDGVCSDGSCCSEWGWCGDSSIHCDNPAPLPALTPCENENTELVMVPVDECSGFVRCVEGTEVGPKISCVGGTLFDAERRTCAFEHEVTCGSPPKFVGTCGVGNVGNGVCSDYPCCSEWGWCGDSSDHCDNPADTGLIMVPVNDCKGFVNRKNGTEVGDEISCVDGTLFDEERQVCTFDSTVTCPPQRKRGLRGSEGAI